MATDEHGLTRIKPRTSSVSAIPGGGAIGRVANPPQIENLPHKATSFLSFAYLCSSVFIRG
jgi:hypothetical protein